MHICVFFVYFDAFYKYFAPGTSFSLKCVACRQKIASRNFEAEVTEVTEEDIKDQEDMVTCPHPDPCMGHAVELATAITSRTTSSGNRTWSAR